MEGGVGYDDAPAMRRLGMVELWIAWLDPPSCSFLSCISTHCTNLPQPRINTLTPHTTRACSLFAELNCLYTLCLADTLNSH
jgi:hypothetical protein